MLPINIGLTAIFFVFPCVTIAGSHIAIAEDFVIFFYIKESNLAAILINSKKEAKGRIKILRKAMKSRGNNNKFTIEIHPIIFPLSS